MWSGLINHFSDRCKTLKEIAKESGYKYALGYREGREMRKREQAQQRKAPSEAQMIDLLKQRYTRAEIARKFGVSKSRITQLFPRAWEIAVLRKP